MLECVINVSEGRDEVAIAALVEAAAAGNCLLDVHTDPHHHRSVFTLGGEAGGVEASARALAAEAVRRVDLRTHVGVHPRLGAVDVVPFVPLDGSDLADAVADALADAVAARDRFATWAADVLGVPCFRFGPERSLPEVRRRAFHDLTPDMGPPDPNPTAGAICVGARPPLVAYNLWLAPGTPVEVARAVAAAIRGPSVRALGLDVGGQAQVSCNLVEPDAVGPARVYKEVAARAPIDRAELVGLVPRRVLDRIDPDRWAALDLSPTRTIEARLEDPRLRVRPKPRSRAGSPPTAGGGDGGAPAR